MACFSRGLCCLSQMSSGRLGSSSMGITDALLHTDTQGFRLRESLLSVMSPAISAKEESSMEKLYSLSSALALQCHMWLPLTFHCPELVTKPHLMVRWLENVDKSIEHVGNFAVSFPALLCGCFLPLLQFNYNIFLVSYLPARLGPLRGLFICSPLDS